MKLIYLIQYFGYYCGSVINGFAGTPLMVDELFYNRTCEYFTHPGDTKRAYNTYLKNKGIMEKPYFLKNGYALRGEFRMSVAAMTDDELTRNYPLKRK